MCVLAEWNCAGTSTAQPSARARRARFCYSKRDALAEDMPTAGGLVYYSRQARSVPKRSAWLRAANRRRQELVLAAAR